MPDYISILLKAINEYNDTDTKSKTTLRDLVCVASEDKEVKKDPVIQSLLYIASQKMRVFGYNVQNNFTTDPDTTTSELTTLRNAAIIENYRSKVQPSNILDKTQKEIIDLYQSLEPKRMLISAPTSYGKTFIMREILFLNKERYGNVLLVFPTVALLQENAHEMAKLNSDLNLNYRVIKSVDTTIDITARNIFVFTPERAMQLLVVCPDIKLDFFFYDEMYKIDEDLCSDELDGKSEDDDKTKGKTSSSFLDEARAKTFRICLYLLAKQAPEYYLAGPNLKRENFGSGMQTFLSRNNIQFYEVPFEPTTRIRVNAYEESIVEAVADIPYAPPPIKELPSNPPLYERCRAIVNYIKDNDYGQSLLYCPSPSEANRYAKNLANGLTIGTISNETYRKFVAHLKKKYDIDGSIEEWSLLNILEKGFAMHHGKLPKYIQKEILQMFNKGIFDLLFCTSTIVEGVNTSARNMVVLSDKKGHIALTTFDLKNIIGRAGRYYHHFIGRYFLVNPKLVTIIDTGKLELDFKTYSESEMNEKTDAVDLDNTETPDLTAINQQHQANRQMKTQDYELPLEVFLQNRLIKKEHQEALLQALLMHENVFNLFYEQLSYPSLFKQFTEWNAMNVVLRIFQSAKLLGEPTVKKYTAVSSGLNENGFQSILSYEISAARRMKKPIDKAYSTAFKIQREIIEYKFPKLLTLFQSIFACAAEKRRRNIGEFSLAKVIRYYETGVKSYFGEQFIEYGFPTDTIREIENKHPDLLSADANTSKDYIQKHKSEILTLLDDYEKDLFQEALNHL